jgi:ribose-phosphate pyrophosphokinase
MQGADQTLADPALERVVVTDSVPAFRLPPGATRDKLDVVPCAPFFAEAIARLHEGRPLTDLLVY